MVWYKSWLDTRWRFLIGLAVLVVMACGNVFDYVQVRELLPTIGSAGADVAGRVAQAIQDAARIQQTYRGYVWYNWFDQGFTFTLFAALLGSGNPLLRSRRGLLFTLALPAARGDWVAARAWMGLAQLLAFALLPSLIYPLISSAIGEQYAVVDALVHGLCAFVAASVLFSFALLLSTVFEDLWRPLLITCLVGLSLNFGEAITPDFQGLFEVMSAETYFNGGSLPWIGLAISAGLTAAFTYAAAANIARRDF